MKSGSPQAGKGIPPLIVALAALLALYQWVFLASSFTAPGLLGPDYHGVGTDWMVFHLAGAMAGEGRIAALYDGAGFTAELNRTYAAWLADPLDYRPWVNPPWFALAMEPLAWLPFRLSWLAGQAAQLALLGWALRRAVPAAPMSALAAVLLAPVIALNALCGQTALLSCALAIAALSEGGRRPWLAGLALALLSYKVQFVPVVGLVLLLEGRWRALGWAVLFGGGLVAISAALLGLAVWAEWIGVVLGGLSGGGAWNDAGRLWGSSAYACVVALGGSAGLAGMVQGAVSFSALVGAAWVERRPMPPLRRIAAVLLLVLLAAPYHAAYDSLFALAALWLAWQEKAFATAGQVLVWLVPLLVWMIPLVSPPALNPAGALTPLILLAALVLMLRASPRLAAPAQAG